MTIAYTPWPEELARYYKQVGVWQGKPLGDILRDSAKRYPKRTALIDGEEFIEYQTLDRRVDRLASGLLAQGIGSGQYVVVQLPNSVAFIEVIFALFRLGAIPVMALPAHRASEIGEFCRRCHAVALIICDEYGGFDYREMARHLVDDNAVSRVFVAGHAGPFVGLNALYREALPINAPDTSSVGLMQLSGGSTGTPKLIPRTHDDYFYSIRQSVVASKLTQDSRYLTALPMAHNFPLSSPGVLGILSVGGAIVLSCHADPDSCFALIDQHKVTITALVPPLALAWLNAVQRRSERHKRMDLSSLRVLQVGGAKLSHEVALQIGTRLQCRLQQVFGMAEGLVCYTDLDASLAEISQTQGRPMSSLDEIRIVDDEDNDVAIGQTGHLLTRGPYTIRGYFRAQQYNCQAFTADGYFRTGDLVCQSEQGCLIVSGRSKDQINRGGEKVAAEEVENHLLAHPLIHDAAVVAMPDQYLGERVCAFVIRHDEALSVSQTMLFLRSRALAQFKLPERIEFVDALPKTHLGKVDKKQLRQLISDKIKLSYSI